MCHEAASQHQNPVPLIKRIHLGTDIKDARDYRQVTTGTASSTTPSAPDAS